MKSAKLNTRENYKLTKPRNPRKLILLETYAPSGKKGLNKKIGNYVKCMYKMYQNLA